MIRLLKALLLWLALPSSAEAETVRVGFFVGNNVGFGEEEPLRRAEAEAEDMARIFQSMGGLARERTWILQGEPLVRFQEALIQVEAQVREITARGDDVLLVFYYSGHASREGLHLAGTLEPMESLRHWLEGSAARVRVAFVDACESGNLTRGGTPVDTIAITVDDALTQTGLAIITSTGPLSVAQEANSFGGGVFSRVLLSGLRGGADMDGDGQITLDEVYGHAFSQTVIATASGMGAVQKPEYHFELAGVGRMVLTRIPDQAAALVLPEELEGSYTVVSVVTGEVVARVDKIPGAVRRIALPPGRYVVRKVRREDVLISEVDLVWGGDRWIEDQAMSVLPLGDPLSRGGWALRPHRVELHLTGASPPIDGNPWMLGGEAGFQSHLMPGLAIRAGGSWEQGNRREWMGALRTTTGRLELGLVSVRYLRRLDLEVGGGLEGLRLSQSIRAIEEDLEDQTFDPSEFEAHQYTAGVFGRGGILVPVGPAVSAEMGLRAHLFRALVNARPGFFIEGQAWLGASVRFGGSALARASRTRVSED